MHNLNDKKEAARFRALGGQGVPFFYSETLRTSYAGNPGSFEALVKQLQPAAVSSKQGRSLKSMNIKIFVSDSCGYCKRLKQMLSSAGQLKDVRIISLSDSDYSSEASKYSFNGYPFIVSETTGKHILGAPPSIETMIQSLS